MEDYEGNANKLIKELGITFEARFVGHYCPRWCDDPKHVHGDEYRCIFRRKGQRPFIVRFWNSLHDKQEGNTPTAYDVLACIQKYDVGTLDDFVSEFGYTKSPKITAIYHAVIKEYAGVINFFKPEEMPLIQEIA